ncbi:MAG: HAD family hydrolase, partial [Candidatus Gastranaerophilaceae bacterium]
MRNNKMHFGRGYQTMIKMVATDIDGTILKWDFGYSPNVKKCIKELTEKGIKY